MNPYLEQDDVWHDLHERFIPLAAELLAPQVRPAYIVKLDEHVYIHELSAEERRFLGRADVAVTQSGLSTGVQSQAVVLEAPARGQILPAVDVERHSFVEIRDRCSRQLITVIGLLSPANKKPGPDRGQYLSKRWQVLSSSTHLVEIDLLRGGPRLPIEGLRECDYYALVSRAEERPDVGLWPTRLRDRLPAIPVPLRAPDPDARLDLQEMLHRLYDTAGYEDYIYTGAPEPPLTPEDATWAQAFVPPRPA
jgi:hypothetical protein